MTDIPAAVELAIIGGGPAGSAAAITAARRGVSVALFEAHEYPRQKVCGEFVSAESRDVLGELLGEWQAIDLFQAASEIRSNRMLFGERTIETPLSPPGVSLTRYVLDRALWLTAGNCGAQTFTNCAVRSIQGRGPFLLRTSGGDCRARAVIVAAGRWSQFETRRELPDGPRWIGLKAHFYDEQPPASTDLYFFDHGYCGVQRVDQHTVNVSAVVRSDRATSLEQVFGLHPQLNRRAENWRQLFKTITTAPLVHRPARPVQGSLMFAGDAAAFLDPFAGDGISIALRSGSMAARAACQYLSGKCSLAMALEAYQLRYELDFGAILTAAARLRPLLMLPRAAKVVIFEMMRLPGVVPYMIRKTRGAA